MPFLSYPASHSARRFSVFNVRRGLVPVKFTLTKTVLDSALPPATIALTRTGRALCGKRTFCPQSLTQWSPRRFSGGATPPARESFRSRAHRPAASSPSRGGLQIHVPKLFSTFLKIFENFDLQIPEKDGENNKTHNI
jgi:hypothetical protein